MSRPQLNGRPDFTMSSQTAKIVKVLRGVNQDISYTALAGMIGVESIDVARSALISARRHLESAEGIVFTTIYGEGLRRLDDTEKVQSTDAHLRRIGRAARRGRKRLGTVENFAALSLDMQTKATLAQAQLECAEQTVSTRKIAAVQLVKSEDITGELKKFKKA